MHFKAPRLTNTPKEFYQTSQEKKKKEIGQERFQREGFFSWGTGLPAADAHTQPSCMSVLGCVQLGN